MSSLKSHKLASIAERGTGSDVCRFQMNVGVAAGDCLAFAARGELRRGSADRLFVQEHFVSDPSSEDSFVQSVSGYRQPRVTVR